MVLENRVKSQELRVKKGKTAIYYVTDKGYELAQHIQILYPDAGIIKFTSAGAIHELPLHWRECKALIFIMASGIVVRTIAPLLKDKRTDPAVVVLDENGSNVISLLSGHLGGANYLAKEIAMRLGGNAVITTASDVNSVPSIDLWAHENNLVIENWNLLPKISTRLLNKGLLQVYTDVDMQLPDEFKKVEELKLADMVITNKELRVKRLELRIENKKNSKFQTPNSRLYLRPKNLVIGIGCNSGTTANEIEEVVKKTLKENNLAFASIHSIATIDKKGNEPGLVSFAGKYNLEIRTFTSDELNRVKGITKSKAVLKAVGANAVAEPAALLAAEAMKLLVPKQKSGNATVAVAERVKSQESRVKKKENSIFKIQDSKLPTKLITHNSKLYIVGTGPGGLEHITPRAQEAIKESDVIVGYGTYLDLIKELTKDKEVVSTGMTQEIDRCRKAIELALEGKAVSVISGGDPGIYAMAGLVFELLKSQESLSVEVIPGISALNACAARLGAPLMHDFASISLSDRLTPWEVIEKRLKAAANADFVIALYNPKSKGRQKHIQRAQEIISKYRKPETPIGIVKAAMRENEHFIITDLRDMLNHDIDMQTTVIIGNSQTMVWNNRMITPRGYENKKQGVGSRGKEGEIRNSQGEKRGTAMLWDESFLWGIMAYKALQNLSLPFNLIRSDDIKNGCLEKYSMLFVPGGWASNKKKALGDKGTEAIREFVKNGGSYLGFCGGAGLATLNGISLLNIKRKPTKERVPSFSGRIHLNVNKHPVWEGIIPSCRGNPMWLPRAGTQACPYSNVFHAWWPSQFVIEDKSINILATYGNALPDSFSSDLNTGDIEASGNWAELEKVYGINLDPKRLLNEPAVVEGSCGKGKVLLSLVHFDTPDDINGQQVLKNLWEYLKTGVRGQGSGVSKIQSPIPNIQSPFVNSEIISELKAAVTDLIAFGERNFLWFWRNPILLQWRRGVRGLEYCTLYVMMKEIAEIAKDQDCRGVLQYTPTEKIKDLLIQFTEKAKRLLILERHALQKGPITYERCEDPEIQKIRAELFSESKSHGGMFKELIDEIDHLLFSYKSLSLS